MEVQHIRIESCGGHLTPNGSQNCGPVLTSFVELMQLLDIDPGISQIPQGTSEAGCIDVRLCSVKVWWNPSIQCHKLAVETALLCDRNSSRPPRQVWVWAITKQLRNMQWGTSINWDCQCKYWSNDICQPVHMPQVFSGLSSGSFCKLVDCLAVAVWLRYLIKIGQLTFNNLVLNTSQLATV